MLIVLLILSGILTACGGEEKKSPAPPRNLIITYEPQPMATLLTGCVASELESWLEVAGTLIYTFRDESLAALTLQPGEMVDTLNRLIDLRDAIARQPTPECAVQPQSQILTVIRGMMTAFQRYSNGVITQDELSQQINGAVEQINSQITVLLEAATTDLEARLEENE
jgi:hypothetical protein